MTITTNKRIHYIDVLKGLGIVFVVFAHKNSIIYGSGYLYSFHMALFFFISGMLINPGKYENTKTFLISRIKQLYIPYVVFYLGLYLYWLLVERRYRSVNISPIDGFLGLFWGSDNMHWIYPGGVMWFVICLLSLEVLFFLIIKIVHSWWFRSGIIVTMTALGIALAQSQFYVLPFSLNNALIALPFLFVGYLFRKPLIIDHVVYKKDKKTLLLYLAPFLLFTIWQYPSICDVGRQTDISGLRMPPLFSFYTIPFVEIALWIIIAMLINKNAILEWLGKNTLPILAFHPPIGRLLNYASNALWGISKAEIKQDWIDSVLMTVISIICCIPFVIIWNKIYPNIIVWIFPKKAIEVKPNENK